MNSSLLAYFPDFKDCQLSEKDFMYGIIWTLSPDAVREMVAEWVKNSSPVMKDDKVDLVEISKELKESILNLFAVKSKLFLLLANNNNIITKRRSSYLLKNLLSRISKGILLKSTSQISQRPRASRECTSG